MKGFLILSVFIIHLLPAVSMGHVFVYGTLKEGQPNHHELLDSINGQAEFITFARTIEPYPLVIAGKYNTPFLLNVSGSGQRVYGEIYRVDQKMLEFLDDFEDCPKLYQRTSIQLEILKENGESGGGLINIISLPAVRMARVFVYGTLKKGQPNYFRLINSSNGQADFVTCARTVDQYPLVIAGKRNVPFLLNVPGSGHRVYGEIYRVDQKMLEYLDWFEKCPEWYQRTSIQLEILKENGESGGVEEAFVYTTTKYEPDWLHKPTYDSYDANGDHGLKFVPREE